MSQTSAYIIGIDIGGTKCSVSLADSRGALIAKSSFPTHEPEGPLQAIDNLFLHTDRILESAPAEILALGIACGSPLDPVQGIIQSPPNLDSWKNVPIVALFRDRYRLPVFLDNDANAGASAEYCFGAGRGCRNMAFLTFGTGLGAGLVLNGQIYRGATCFAGEVGHIRLASSGPIGYRKAGSFEGFCSGGGISQLATMLRAEFAGTTELGETPTAQEVGEAAERGDRLAREVLEHSGAYLGRGLAILLDILNLERIVIGSIFKRCEQFLRPAMELTLREEALEQVVDACEILPSELGERVGDLAAVSVALSELNLSSAVTR